MIRRPLLRAASFAVALSFALAARLAAEPAADGEPETVVLIHGLYRKPSSLWLLERRLTDAGYRVVKLGYPSRAPSFAELVAHVRAGLDACCADGRSLHFVTHSLGGLVVRALAAESDPPPIGRVVMLAPPNQGSELADLCDGLPLSRQIVGPLVSELGTGVGSAPLRLPPASFPVGVIAGTRSVYPFVGLWLRGDNDGVVSVARTALDGMSDRILVPAAHPMLINSAQVAEETIHFLRSGRFSESARRPMTNGSEEPRVGG